MLVIGFMLFMYVMSIIPIIVSFKRQNNPWIVIIISMFFGWTLIGWVIALCIALNSPRQPQATVMQDGQVFKLQEPVTPPKPAQDGIMSEEEEMKINARLVKILFGLLFVFSMFTPYFSRNSLGDYTSVLRIMTTTEIVVGYGIAAITALMVPWLSSKSKFAMAVLPPLIPIAGIWFATFLNL
ncbi:superinfection immunity protein [Pantoea sp. T14]|uniref:superinfection immunity protein n=1 Tax=Pantoea sp. T14 TaxID=3085685 RepID=UPI002FC73A77